MSTQKNIIQLQRQGVSNTLRAHFCPCPHGHDWYLELHDYQGRGFIGELNTPNCYECFGQHRGQIDWSTSPHGPAEPKPLETVKAAVLKHLPGYEFAPFVEAYMCYSDADLRIWPFLADDVYITCATYEPGSDTIRHQPTNECLVAFDGPTTARLDIDAATLPYRAKVEEAYLEFLKPFNQRDGERAAKTWLAWLIGEYIKALPGQSPAVLKSMVRVGPDVIFASKYNRVAVAHA
ncbi:MAG: hypothetical protein ABFD89_28830 [Bryobacteraceae bacterium]